MKRHLLIAALLATVLSACQKRTPPPSCPVPGCFTPSICTTQFSQVFIHVQDADGTPTALDSFVVTDAAGVPLPPSSAGANVWGSLHSGAGIMPGGCVMDGNGINGAYSIINDGWTMDHQNTKTQVWAKGYIGGHAVFSEAYVIATDCCQASRYQGKEVIAIQ